MNIVPARIQEQIGRVDRNYALAIGISAGVTALWSIYRMFYVVGRSAVSCRPILSVTVSFTG